MMDASRLGFDPLIPWLALWILAGAAFALWGAYIYFRGKAWLFRALALTVLTLALANPLWIEEQREPLKDAADHRARRAEQLAQGGLGQARAGREPLVHDRVEDGAVDPVVHRGPAFQAIGAGLMRRACQIRWAMRISAR